MSLLIRHHMGALRAAWGRWLALLAALALSVAAVVALLQGGGRLRAAMAENYLATRPAHAQLLLRPGWNAALAERLLAELRGHDGVVAARWGASARVRVQAAGGALREGLLFALRQDGRTADAEAADPRDRAGEVALPRLAQGRWPGVGEALIERDAAQFLADPNTLTLADGRSLRVSGRVHDAALAPASTEGMVYAYLPATDLLRLPRTDHVLLRFSGVETGPEGVPDGVRADTLARRSAAWLNAQGLAVAELRVPPVGEHPHQRQADGAVQMLLACAGLSALLSAVTAGALLSAWLDSQRHALGVLKALGASRGALLRSVLALVATLCVGAAVLGLSLGLAAGEALAQVSAALLNLTLLPWSPGRQAVAAAMGLGVALPLLITAGAVWVWVGQSVRVAFSARALARPGLLDRMPLPGPLTLRLTLRSLVRRRRRFMLSATLLSVAGAVFMGGLTLRAAGGGLAEHSAAQRLYAIELRLPESAALAAVTTLPGVVEAEAWDTRRATWVGSDGLAMSRAYPDGGHGQLLLRTAPQSPRLQRFELTQGRWFAPAPGAATVPELVANAAALALLDGPVRLGATLSVVTGETRLTGNLVGISREPMSPPTVYLRASAGAGATHWRLRLAPGVSGEQARDAVVERWPAARVVTEADLRGAAAGHVQVLQRALSWVGLGTGLVGLVALASALGSSVAERRRERFVLRALGASRRLLGSSVMLEATGVVMLSLLLAWAVSAVLDPLLTARLGAISGQPLRAIAAPGVWPLWAAVALVVGLLASLLPARAAASFSRASRPPRTSA